MVPEFDKAAFESEIGDIKTVETQYGTHLLKVTDQKNTSRAVKIAVIDKPLEPSQATKRAIYANANAFAASLTAEANFAPKAQKAGLTTSNTENVHTTNITPPTP